MFYAMDKIGAGLSRLTRGRFQWPCWLLDWAWNRQATPYVPARTGTPDD